jgi:hypothetical protein
MGADDDDASGKRKGRKVWLFVKNTSMALTVLMFFFTVILVLDAYKFVSIRVSIGFFLVDSILFPLFVILLTFPPSSPLLTLS